MVVQLDWFASTSRNAITCSPLYVPSARSKHQKSIQKAFILVFEHCHNNCCYASLFFYYVRFHGIQWRQRVNFSVWRAATGKSVNADNCAPNCSSADSIQRWRTTCRSDCWISCLMFFGPATCPGSARPGRTFGIQAVLTVGLYKLY
jgi:hypothetical protein